MEKPNKQIQVAEQKLNQALLYAQRLEIIEDRQLVVAIDELAGIKQLADQLKIEKEKITVHLNEWLRNARLLFKPLETAYEQAETLIKDKMAAYKHLKDETSGDPMVETTIMGMSGAEASFRRLRRAVVVDEKKLPARYWKVDQERVDFDALKKGISIPGVEIQTETSVAIRK